jgi:hypothetical protein
MRLARFIGATVLAIVAGVGVITYAALELQEVALLRTRDPGGAVHETRVWIADEDDSSWIEAATPERVWYQRVLEQPAVEVVRGSNVREFRAVPRPGPEGHAKIRRLLREKYGPADWWVGLFQDTSGSVAIQLRPAGSD